VTVDADPASGADYCTPLPPLPDGVKAQAWDQIMAVHFIEHLPVWDAETLIRECYECLAPGGALVLALFAERTLRELHEAWLHVAGGAGAARMHRFFKRHEVAEAVIGAGLELVALDEEEIVERHPDARAVLRAIRAVGAGNAVPRGEGGGLGGRSVTLALLARYDGVHGGPDGVPATYHVVYAVARRPG
jgi:malonyl-CoA O-methyltransferase